MKECRDCKAYKDPRDFCKNRRSPDGLCDYCRECHRKRNAAYKKTERGRVAQRRHNRHYGKTEAGKLSNQQKSRRRRERVRGLELRLSLEDIELIHRRFGDQCFNCGSEKRLEIDHHYPLNQGFGLELSNAALLCKSCNSAKKDRLPEEFYSEGQLLALDKLLL